MKHLNRRKASLVLAAVTLAGIGSLFLGCVRESNGTFIVNEAPLPKDWPTLTPVDQIEVKTYPVYRAAFVATENTAPEQDPTGKMFNQLFGHIKANDIPMTAPVEMGYGPDDTPDDAAPRMRFMAFLYRAPDQGRVAEAGGVNVRDLPPQTVVSIGVRGDYTPQQYAEALARLDTWLTEHTFQYVPAGPPRALGYNSPFVPGFLRYGEVQIPITPRNPS